MPDSAWWDQVRADRDRARDPIQLHARIRIRSKHQTSAVGVIEQLLVTDQLRDLPGLPLSGETARKILREWNATRLAFIRVDQTYIFAALEIGGRWFDLRGQELTLEAAR